ncbi:MAG: formylmethanofuran dehydrogenase subunit B [Isosphaeraceae bacterium]
MSLPATRDLEVVQALERRAMITVNAEAGRAGSHVEPDVVCAHCPCLCDDIELHVQDGRIIEAKNACAAGRDRFLAIGSEDDPSCWIDGGPARFEQAVERAASILASAHFPVVFGLGGATCEAQRAAVAVADRIGACIDATGARGDSPSTMALQSVGEVTCTLGEIRNRADLVVVWGADPAVSHPRLFERHVLEPTGLFVPAGRAGRYCIVVDDTETESVRTAADEWIALRPGAHFEALWSLRAMLRGADLDPDALERSSGVPLPRWRALVERMKAARYGVLIYGPDRSADPSGPSVALAAHAFVRELNDRTRFVVLPLGASGNDHGAGQVLAWQTGYPGAVSLADGVPRYGPGEFTAGALLARGEADAALVVSGNPNGFLDNATRAGLARIPLVVLGSAGDEAGRAPAVVFRTPDLALRTRGTVFRMDGVALALRPVLPSMRPSAEEVLRAIECRLATLRASGVGRPVREDRPCP